MKFKSMVLSFLLLFCFNLFVAGSAQSYDLLEKSDYTTKQNGGIDYVYSSPEIFFTNENTLKLSVLWEILNCFYWDNGTPVNQCINMEFLVANETIDGHQIFTSPIEGTQCFRDDCEAIIQLPILALLTPREYERWQDGYVVIKHLKLFLAFGGEEDEYGRIINRKLSNPYYHLKYILNGTGFGSVAAIRLERIEPTMPLH